jgi:hypothetical protein
MATTREIASRGHVHGRGSSLLEAALATIDVTVPVGVVLGAVHLNDARVEAGTGRAGERVHVRLTGLHAVLPLPHDHVVDVELDQARVVLDEGHSHEAGTVLADGELDLGDIVLPVVDGGRGGVDELVTRLAGRQLRSGRRGHGNRQEYHRREPRRCRQDIASGKPGSLGVLSRGYRGFDFLGHVFPLYVNVHFSYRGFDRGSHSGKRETFTLIFIAFGPKIPELTLA